jgi:hypothetical protein
MSIRSWWQRLFPEKIFSRKLEPAAERRLRLALARAEESITRSHVDNALMFVDVLAEDMTFDRAIDTYIREMAVHANAGRAGAGARPVPSPRAGRRGEAAAASQRRVRRETADDKAGVKRTV